jgi:actin-related protein
MSQSHLVHHNFKTSINMSDELILVIDIGSSSVKAGYSGEDIPPYVFPSTLSKGYNSTTEVDSNAFHLTLHFVSYNFPFCFSSR